MHKKNRDLSKKIGGDHHKHHKHWPKKAPWFGELIGKRGTRVDRGETRYLILDTLAEKGCHGYEIMQRIQEKTGGFYRPSPGTVYPNLQMLEDLELITSRDEGNRRTYQLSAAGRKELQQQRPLVEDIYKDLGQGQSLEQHEFLLQTHDQVMKMFKLISRSFQRGRLDSAKTDEIHTIIQTAVQGVAEILKDDRDKLSP